MKIWTEEKLIEEGYDIRNAQIKGAELTMENHGCISLNIAYRLISLLKVQVGDAFLADIVSDTVIWG